MKQRIPPTDACEFETAENNDAVNKHEDQSLWLTTKETKKILRISNCHLMHLRLDGKLQFRKEGNRFFYLAPKQLEK